MHTPILTANDCEGAGDVFAVEVNLLDLLCLVSFYIKVFVHKCWKVYHLAVMWCFKAVPRLEAALKQIFTAFVLVLVLKVDVLALASV